MPTFEYQAQGADGQVVRGRAFGPSLDHVARQLASQGMQVLSIGVAQGFHDPLATLVAPSELPSTETGSPGQASVAAPTAEAPPTEQRSYVATSVAGPLVGRAPLVQLAFFFRQLGTMLDAGVPIVQSLDTLATQARSPKLRTVIEELRDHANAGRPLSVGVQRYPEVFSPVVVSLLRAGEEGGFLVKSLFLVADYLDREIHLRNLYKRLTFYPKLQVAASILIILVANWIIGGLGGSMKLSSPLTNLATWFVLAPVIVGLFLFFRVGLANPGVKHAWDTFVSNVPYLGVTMRQLAMAKFGRAFGALYQGGIAMPKAMTLAADACGNEFLRARMYPAYKELEQGAGLTETLAATDAFTPIVLNMIETGERTGNLDQMLGKMSEFYEGESEVRSVQLAQVVGVAVFLAVALYIAYIVIGFWSGYGAQYDGI
jgi:type II secretory pathway component PulF